MRRGGATTCVPRVQLHGGAIGLEVGERYLCVAFQGVDGGTYDSGPKTHLFLGFCQFLPPLGCLFDARRV